MNKEQLEARRKGIGGSDVSGVLGMSPWNSPLDVYMDKVGDAPPTEETEPMWWGTAMEPLIAARYEIETGRKVVPVDEMLQHPEHEWALGNLDGRVDDERIIELKTTRWAKRDDWGASGTDEVPLHYLAQVYWYIWVSGAEVCDLAALLGGSELRIYEVPRNDKLIAQIVEQCRAFWFDHVVAGVPPDPSTNAEAVVRWPSSEGTMKEASHADLNVLGELDLVKGEQAALKQRRDKLELLLKQSIGSNDGLADDSGTCVTWKSQFTKRFDTTRYKKECPDTYDAFVKVSESRVLRPKKRK